MKMQNGFVTDFQKSVVIDGIESEVKSFDMFRQTALVGIPTCKIGTTVLLEDTAVYDVRSNKVLFRGNYNKAWEVFRVTPQVLTLEEVLSW